MANADELLKNYIANEQIFNFKGASLNQKLSAWRENIICLSGLETDQTTKHDLLEKHYNKIENFENEFIIERLGNVQNLLKDYKIIAKPPTKSDFVENISYRAQNCLGNYETCQFGEISQEDLDLLCKDDDDELDGGEICGRTDDAAHKTKSKVELVRNERPTSITNWLQGNSRSKPNFDLINQGSVISGNQRKNQSVAPIQTEKSNNELPTFRTAREEAHIQNSKKYGSNQPNYAYGVATKKTLGTRGRSVRSNFVPPVRKENELFPRGQEEKIEITSSPEIEDERLANVDPKMIELVKSEIMHKFKPINWSDIAGLEYAKSIIKEAVVYPMLRPDIFTGLRRPPRGILLFGPPGTGKTLIGKCIASQSGATFFSISASSLTSKWIGDSEKMVRTLFAVAAVHQPAVIFIDEIDSLLTQRSDTEHESSRRLKTEFLVQLDGAGTSEEDRILIVGATNRPQDLDEAARRRLVRRLYIPLPEFEARVQILINLLNEVRHNLTYEEIENIARRSEGYSGADMKSLCHEASMEPIRSIPPEEMSTFKKDNVRPVVLQDFFSALASVRPSVSQDDLKEYSNWNSIYGAAR